MTWQIECSWRSFGVGLLIGRDGAALFLGPLALWIEWGSDE